MKTLWMAVAALLTSTAAQADRIVLDDFSQPQSVADVTNDGSAVSMTSTYLMGGNIVSRTLSINQTEHDTDDPTLLSSASISYGTLRVTNDTRTNSVFGLTYEGEFGKDLPEGSSLLASLLLADASLGMPVTISAFLNDKFIESQTLTGVGVFETLLPRLAPSANKLQFVITGGTSFDATFGATFYGGAGVFLLQRVEQGLPIPEPGAFGLLGVGLLALAFRRSRRST